MWISPCDTSHGLVFHSSLLQKLWSVDEEIGA